MPRIAICVVTFNSAELIKDLVASIPEGAEGVDWSLVVADNASSDESVAEVARWAPDAKVIQMGQNRGYASGMNAAIRAAGAQDAYLVLNPDVRLGVGCLAKLFNVLSPRVGIAVPRLNDGRGDLIWSLRREPTLLRAWSDALVGAARSGRIPPLGEVVTDPDLYKSPAIVDWAEGSTQLISAACLETCGPWDETYFLYSEETEFDLRAADRGFLTLYEPAATATHLKGGSSTTPRLWSLVVANRVLMFRRRHGPIASALFWCALVIRESSRTILGKPTSRAAFRDLVKPTRLAQARSPEWLDGVGA